MIIARKFILSITFLVVCLTMVSQEIREYKVIRIDSTDHRMTVELDSLFLRNTQEVVNLIQKLYLTYPSRNLKISFFHDGDYSLVRGETKEKGIENFHKNHIAEYTIKTGKLWYLDEFGLKKKSYDVSIDK